MFGVAIQTALGARFANGGRADLHPHGANDSEEEEKDEHDHTPLHDSQHGGEILCGEDEVPGDKLLHVISKMSLVDPTPISSPLTKICSRTGVPFTRVPLVEPRSVRTTPSPTRRSSAWRRLTLESCRTTPHSGSRPMTRGSVPIWRRLPSGRISSARKPPSAPSRTSATTENRPALKVVPS